MLRTIVWPREPLKLELRRQHQWLFSGNANSDRPRGLPATETDGSGNWQHTNVYSAGRLLATYDVQGLHFFLTDPLGTRRVQTEYAGQVEGTDTSLP